MGRIEKIITALLRKPPEARFSDIQYVLTYFGYELDNSDGSHFIYRHPDTGDKITVPTVKGRKVKTTYVVRVIQKLDLEEWHEEE